jgi:hypothetical protein
LEDFAEEMKVYLDILDDLKLEIDERPMGRSWMWLKFWQKSRTSRDRSKFDDPGKMCKTNMSEMCSDYCEERHIVIDQDEETDPPSGIASPTERRN